METAAIVQRLEMLKADARSFLRKAERSHRSEPDKELCRSVYGKDIAALDAAIAIVSAPTSLPEQG